MTVAYNMCGVIDNHMGYKALSVSEEVHENIQKIKEHGGFDTHNSVEKELVSLYLDDRGIDLQELPDRSDANTSEVSPENIYDEIDRQCEALDLSPEAVSRAKEIADIYYNEEYAGNGKQGKERPDTIAAASVYVAALLVNEKRTQVEVAEVAGCIEVTIRKKQNKILDFMGIY